MSKLAVYCFSSRTQQWVLDEKTKWIAVFFSWGGLCYWWHLAMSSRSTTARVLCSNIVVQKERLLTDGDHAQANCSFVSKKKGNPCKGLYWCESAAAGTSEEKTTWAFLSSFKGYRIKKRLHNSLLFILKVINAKLFLVFLLNRAQCC